MKKKIRPFFWVVIKLLTVHKFEKVFCFLVSKVIKGVTEWFSSLFKDLRGVITELSNSLFLLLCLKDVITRLSYLWIFYTSVSENISKSSKKIFNLLHPKAVIIAIKYEFSSCSVSKLWSEGSLCEFFSSLFQSNDQGAQRLF